MKMRKILQANRWLLLGMLLLICILFGLSAMANGVTEGLYSQQQAARWKNGKDPYAQVSAFFEKEKGAGTDFVSSVRGNMLSKLSEDGFLNSETSKKTWLDAYSGERQLSIKRNENSMSVTAVGVGGDFFQFHPIPLKSGSYLTSADINGDRVVIDEQVAWNFFGSNDVVGMNIQIGDRIYNIAGVTDIPEDTLYENTYGEYSRIYLNFDELKIIDEQAAITCYEAVLPNPITNYAYGVISQACGVSSDSTEGKKDSIFFFGDCEIVENSSRFGVVAMYGLFKTSKYRSAKTNGVVYPFWENIARIKEEKVMHIRCFQVFLLLCLVILLVVMLIRTRRVIGPVSFDPVKKILRQIPKPVIKKRKRKTNPEEEMVGEDDDEDDAGDELDDAGDESDDAEGESDDGGDESDDAGDGSDDAGDESDDAGRRIG